MNANYINFFLIFIIIISCLLFIFYYNNYLNEQFSNNIYYNDEVNLINNNLFNNKLTQVLSEKLENNRDLRVLSDKKHKLRQQYNMINQHNNLLLKNILNNVKDNYDEKLQEFLKMIKYELEDNKCKSPYRNIDTDSLKIQMQSYLENVVLKIPYIQYFNYSSIDNKKKLNNESSITIYEYKKENETDEFDNSEKLYFIKNESKYLSYKKKCNSDFLEICESDLLMDNCYFIIEEIDDYNYIIPKNFRSYRLYSKKFTKSDFDKSSTCNTFKNTNNIIYYIEKFQRCNTESETNHLNKYYRKK